MKNYHLSRGPPRCAFKVDIQKAYDTVDWNFLRTILINFGFHQVMAKWIMKCVSTALFSINVNGSLHGYFKGKKGLRQGDPLSPYLFTMAMEVFTLMLKRNIRRVEAFQFHPKCERQEIINVCFADDLFMFSYANVDSVKVISDALQKFKNCSGLVPSLPKSTAFFANVGIEVKNQIMEMMHFEAVKNKIDDWKNKSLSFAGSIQLVASVLSPMQVYWSSIFILPKAIIQEIEAVSRGFLWCQGDTKRGKAKVKWDAVCLPKSEGGLCNTPIFDI
ncbi:putative reverse transcriptase domain, reverse transcriptase zinc-binding domain protein [Tanacetum coccineum]